MFLVNFMLYTVYLYSGTESSSGAEVMLFDPRPKTSKDLYNFDMELNELTKNIGKPMIIVQ